MPAPGPRTGGSVLRQFSQVQHGGGIACYAACDQVAHILENFFAALTQHPLADGAGKTVVQAFTTVALPNFFDASLIALQGDGVGGPAVDQRADALGRQRHAAESGSIAESTSVRPKLIARISFSEYRSLNRSR